VRIAAVLRLALCLVLMTATFAACSRDLNVRKQRYFHHAQSYLEKNQYREAAIEFVNALKIDPSYAEAHYGLAQCYVKTQQPTRAYQEFARTVELQPENYSARIEMAALLISHGELQLAQDQTDWLLQHRPDESKTHLTAANLLAAKQDFPAAVAEMQKAIALAPGDAELYLQLALMLLKNGQPDAAEANFKKAVELNPKAADAWLLMATYHQARGWYGQAEQEIRHAIDADPKNPEPRAAIARLYLAQGKKVEAEEFLKQVKHDFPDNSVGYRMLGDFYSLSGDLDKAVAEYAALISEHPKDLVVKKNYVQLLILKNRYAEARNLNEEILQASPNDGEALLYRGELQVQAGDVNGAIGTLQSVIKSDPSNAAAHYQLGVAFQISGDLENTESEWWHAARLDPNMVEAQRSLAILAMQKGDMGTLEQVATEFIKLQPGSAEGYALRAVSEVNLRQFKAAEADISKAIAVAPQSHLGYVQLGNLKLAQKQYSDAGKAYRQALDRDPNSTDALRGLMNTYMEQNKPDEAIAVANAQIAKAPINSSFYDLLGSALSQNKKDLKAAETFFRKAIELDKNNIDALIKLGQVQAAQGETDQAVATYQQAIKDHPRVPQFFILLGGLYESKEEWAKAEDEYRAALELKPNDPTASNNLANVMLQGGGNVDMALSLAQTARRGMPDSPSVADTLGWVYYQKGVYGSAINLFQEALRLQEKNKEPDNPNIHYHLGMAYLKTKRPVLAREQLERALKIDPNYQEAAAIKKLLGNLHS